MIKFPEIKAELDEKIKGITGGFLPSFDTCYYPQRLYNKGCKDCECRGYVYCKESDNYKTVMKEMK